MKRSFVAAAVFIMAALATATLAQEYKVGNVIVDHPWARASIGQAKAGAAYITLVNKGAETDRLVSAKTAVAKRAGLHTNLIEDGVMKMRPVEAVEIAPGEPTVLQPGGIHIMLMGLKAPLVEGTSFPLTLTFEKAGSIEVEVTIQKATDMTPREHGHTGS